MTYPVRYGGDSGNRILVLYWRCPLIRVSVIKGSTVFTASPRQQYFRERVSILPYKYIASLLIL